MTDLVFWSRMRMGAVCQKADMFRRPLSWGCDLETWASMHPENKVGCAYS